MDPSCDRGAAAPPYLLHTDPSRDTTLSPTHGSLMRHQQHYLTPTYGSLLRPHCFTSYIRIPPLTVALPHLLHTDPSCSILPLTYESLLQHQQHYLTSYIRIPSGTARSRPPYLLYTDPFARGVGGRAAHRGGGGELLELSLREVRYLVVHRLLLRRPRAGLGPSFAPLRVEVSA